MTEDMLSWLRREVEAAKATAEAAEAVSPGPWANTGQDGDGDAWQIHGAPTPDSGDTWSDEAQDVVPVGCRVATLNYDDGGGVWEQEAADHIVLQQPRDTIARCEAELRILDDLLPEIASMDSAIECEWNTCSSAADQLLKLLAYARRHRPGYLPEWAPEGTTS